MLRFPFAAGLAILAVLPTLADDEKKAIAYVEKREGKVEIDRDRPDRPVVGVDLVGCKVPENALAQLKVFGKLKRLNLGQSTISDAGLAPLTDLAGLEEL